MATPKKNQSGKLMEMRGRMADYIKREKEGRSGSFLLICPECGAVETKKRWTWEADVKESKRKEFKEKLCPGCVSIKNQWVEGEVLLKNKIISLVPEQIEETIRNLEEELRHTDPKNRIVQIKKGKTFWKVFTATPFLARRIGEKLEKTYNSKVSYKWSKGEKFVSITWE